ncbi:MAG: ADP-heptose synthase [Verrucomicrobiae bacterium]|nr:ADP-heptose synthase [Verrucomicrobiae bacterium]
MGSESKIIPWDEIEAWRARVRSEGRSLAVTNGCFDIIHSGHVIYLENARKEADLLLVGVDSDLSVRAIKGPGRPVNAQEDRARVLAAMEAVSAVCIFEGVGAMDFLKKVMPDVYVKGGDYTLETLVPEERAFMEKSHIRIVLSPGVQGKSTTGVIEKLFASRSKQEDKQ